MNERLLLSRRTVLRGLGVGLALPWLEAMGPLTSWAAESSSTPAPSRMAFLYVPNGANMADWTPSAEGASFELPAILEPLAPVKDQLLVLSGLTADKARSNGDGGGDHARAQSAFLTGAQPRKTDGPDIRAGVSVDQLAAKRIGDQTRLPSLEIGGEHKAMTGNCDSGYNCVYSSTMSWRSAIQPMPKEVDPRIVFDRMFGSAVNSRRTTNAPANKSILDYAREDSKDLKAKLGAGDQRKMEEYLNSVREVERNIARVEKLPEKKAPDNYAKPSAIPDDYQEHLRLMADLLVLAFQSDITRVSTFVLSNEGSNRPYPFIGVSEGHHETSHHGNDAKKKKKIRDINRFHVEQLAYFLGKLNAIPEGDGTLLDHCMIVYGSGNSDGNSHSHDDLPILLAGKGCGTIKTGRHVRYPKETPLTNLWLAMLDRVNVKVATLGDSTGSLPGLSG